jgi:hypothetical protein
MDATMSDEISVALDAPATMRDAAVPDADHPSHIVLPIVSG